MPWFLIQQDKKSDTSKVILLALFKTLKKIVKFLLLYPLLSLQT